MVKKKTFDKDELAKMSAEEVIDKIQHEDYSLLTTLGAEDLREEMVNVGEYIFNLKDDLPEIGVTHSDAKTLLRKTIIAFMHKIYVDMHLELEREKRESAK